MALGADLAGQFFRPFQRFLILRGFIGPEDRVLEHQQDGNPEPAGLSEESGHPTEGVKVEESIKKERPDFRPIFL